MTLESDIRHYIDSAAPPISMEEIATAGPGRPAMLGADRHDSPGINHRRGLVPSLLVGAAAIGLAAVAAIVVTDPFQDDPTVLATDATAPRAGGLSVGSWENVGDPNGVFVPSDVVDTSGNESGASGISVSAVTPTADGLVAVGWEQVGFFAVAAVWSTSDGLTWDRVDAGSAAFGELGGERGDFAPTGFSMTDVTTDGETIVAVGDELRDDVSPTAWTSTSGSGWQRVRLPAEPSRINAATGVVSTSAGFIALGYSDSGSIDGSGHQTLVWVSSDGVDWSRIGNPGFEAGDIVIAVETMGDRIVAVGTTGGLNATHAAAWVSDNAGQTWARATMPAAPTDRPVTEMVDVAVGPDGLLAVGHQAVAGDSSWVTDNRDGSRTLEGQQDIVIWFSPDGTDWQQAGELGLQNQITIRPSITAGPGGFLVSFTTVTETTIEASSWLTIDGSQLDQIDHPTGRWFDVITPFANRYISIASPLPSAGPTDPAEPAPPLEIWRLPFTE